MWPDAPYPLELQPKPVFELIDSRRGDAEFITQLFDSKTIIDR